MYGKVSYFGFWGFTSISNIIGGGGHCIHYKADYYIYNFNIYIFKPVSWLLLIVDVMIHNCLNEN